ncbi:MAG: pitrilysin family protein [Patescibacteria group bacterium]|nr:pitrilysin family protein [Patescibacteria group bacterium]MDD4304090.1 pitrilysin family protein [Patescibacteria group bacterium]MDD4694967.1 pitrilysin family protein [Patescibacteria group bacterium]
MKNIFYKKLNDTQAVTVLVLVKTGSRYENDKNRGVAHFIEHLLFKGTKKRPNSLSITKELDGIGAEYNAFTTKDKTGYYIKASKENLELALDILSDMLFHSKFDLKEINRERGVVLEEFNMYFDNPIMFLDDLLEASIFDKHSLGKLTLGEKEIIKNIKRDEILKFYKKYYKPENMIIGVAGNFSDDIEKIVKKYFKITNFGTKKTFDLFKSSQEELRLSCMNKDTDQIHVAIGFLSVSCFDKDFYSLKLLSIILGANMSSRLFVRMREQLGLCYYIRSNSDNYEDTGAFSITAGLDKNKIESAISNIFLEIEKIKAKKVSQEELKRAKEFLKGKLVLKMEDSENVVDWHCERLLFYNKDMSVEDMISNFNKISSDDILKIANKIFKKSKINIAIIGSEDIKHKISNIIKKLK